MYRRSQSQVAHLGITVRVGSRNDPASFQGISHFTEHMLFKGTSRLSNHSLISQLESAGTDVNAFTTKEETCVFASVQARYLKRIVRLLSQVLCDSQFPEKEIQKERQVIFDEIDAYRDNPAESIFDDFDELLFPSHPLGWNILGTRAGVRATDRQRLNSHFHQYYHPSRMAVSCVAPNSFQAVCQMVGEMFAQTSDAPMTVLSEAIPTYGPRLAEKKASRHQAHIMLGCRAYNAFDSRRYGLALLNNILGGPAMNSLLSMAIREKKGIAYQVESNYQPLSDSGIFSIYFGTDAALCEKALSIVKEILARLCDKPLTARQLHQARVQLKGQMAVSMESAQGEMLAMSKNLLLYGKVEDMNETFVHLDSIQPAQLHSIARDVFDPLGLSMLQYLPRK